jgi:hypothetical protein
MGEAILWRRLDRPGHEYAQLARNGPRWQLTGVAAAEAVDRKAETLPAPIVEAILAVRPRTLTRAIHRRQHLDQIERALAG